MSIHVFANNLLLTGWLRQGYYSNSDENGTAFISITHKYTMIKTLRPTYRLPQN